MPDWDCFFYLVGLRSLIGKEPKEHPDYPNLFTIPVHGQTLFLLIQADNSVKWKLNDEKPTPRYIRLFRRT